MNKTKTLILTILSLSVFSCSEDFLSSSGSYLAMKDVNKEVSIQAKIRANSTAISYNEYILKNSFLWADNIPEDIKSKLEIIE